MSRLNVLLFLVIGLLLVGAAVLLPYGPLGRGLLGVVGVVFLGLGLYGLARMGPPDAGRPF